MVDAHTIPETFLDFGNIVNGKKIPSARPVYTGTNPRSGQPLWNVPVANEEDVEEALKAATQAARSWALTTFAERSNILIEWADKIKDNRESLIPLIEIEGGKPLPLAQNEVDLTVVQIKKYARFDVTRHDELVSDGRKILLNWVPRGVALAITPFNFPILIGAGKIASSIMAGCPCIVKPSPYTPYSTLKIVELSLGIFPDGVLQVLGSKDDPSPWLAERLITDPRIDVISFTGSNRTAGKVRLTAAKSVKPKRIIEELGGNNPTIVCEGVDVAKTAQEIVEDVMRNCGQVCVSSSRIYIPSNIYEEFRKEVQIAANGYTATGKLGPLQNVAQQTRLRKLLTTCEEEKWNVLAGGKLIDSAGYFMEPTIIDNPPEGSLVAIEEAFAPLASLFPYIDLEKAIELANRGDNNLAACIYSPSTAQRNEIAAKLRAGTIFHNSFARPKGDVPMPGCGGSGIGNEGGLEGVKEFCRLKVQHLAWE